MALVKTCGTVFYNYNEVGDVDLGNECFCHFRVNPNADLEASLRKLQGKLSNSETNQDRHI